MKVILLFCFVGSIGAGLRDKAKLIYIGNAATVEELIKDPLEYALVGKEFNMFTPGNELKWDAVEAVRGIKNYTRGDLLVKYAQEHNMRIRGHCLVWHGQLPNWVNDRLGKAELSKAMESRIKDEVGRYKGKFYAWDVVNEVLEWNGKLRDSVWSRNFGESFIEDAFRLAHAADPSAKLYINEFNIDGINLKSNGMYDLVKRLKSKGVPIHGIGLQGHIGAGNLPSDHQAVMEKFVGLGVEVALTEFEVSLKLPSNQASIQQQAKDYGDAVKHCVNVKGCVGVTIWGCSDKNSRSESMPFDKNFKPKPAVAAIEAELR